MNSINNYNAVSISERDARSQCHGSVQMLLFICLCENKCKSRIKTMCFTWALSLWYYISFDALFLCLLVCFGYMLLMNHILPTHAFCHFDLPWNFWRLCPYFPFLLSTIRNIFVYVIIFHFCSETTVAPYPFTTRNFWIYSSVDPSIHYLKFLGSSRTLIRLLFSFCFCLSHEACQ